MEKEYLEVLDWVDEEETNLITTDQIRSSTTRNANREEAVTFESLLAPIPFRDNADNNSAVAETQEEKRPATASGVHLRSSNVSVDDAVVEPPSKRRYEYDGRLFYFGFPYISIRS